LLLASREQYKVLAYMSTPTTVQCNNSTLTESHHASTMKIHAVLVLCFAQYAHAFVKTSVSPFSAFSSRLHSTTSTETEILSDKALLLQGALQGSQSSAKQFLEDIRSIENEDDRDAQLNEVLDGMENLPRWARFGFCTRFSKRARRASLARTIDFWSPPPVASESVDPLRRKRRTLLSVVQALSQDGAKNIRTMERRTKRAQKSSLSASDREDRIPSDLETPNFHVVDTEKLFEVRTYEDFSVCSFEMTSDTEENKEERSSGSIKAFQALAGYLFGKNKDEVAMKMTTPVLSTGSGTNKQMSFVLPSDYWKDAAAAPQPLNDSGVSLTKVPGTTRAVTMFGGYASQQKATEKENALRVALEASPAWTTVEGEPVLVAQYNDPFTPPWKRLNEVSIAVTRK